MPERLPRQNVPMTTKKKLLVFASTFPRWKNDTLPPFVYELSKRLTNKFDVYVLAPSFPGAKDFEIMDEMKVYRFHYFIKKYEKLAGNGGILPTLKKNPFYYFQVPFFLLGEYFALKKTIKKINPDVIHAHWIIPQGWICSLMPKKLRKPYVVTTHGGDIFGLQGKFLDIIKRKTLQNAKSITVVSNAIKKEILKKLDSNLKIEVMSMGVDSKLFNPTKKDLSIKKKYNIKGPFLLFVGRLVEKKGVSYLLDAMPKVLEENPKAKLMIIGTGPLEEKLKEQTKKLGIEKNIIFMGAIQNKELPKYYATADVFVGPSIKDEGGDTEGLGLTLVEAGMCGCWLVGSDVGGISDIIKDGENGFLVKEKDTEDLAKKIISSLKLIGKRKKNTSFNKFDWEIIKEKYAEVLK